jgi:tight adherence protein B
MTPLAIAGTVFLAILFLSMTFLVLITARAESTGRKIKSRLDDLQFGGPIMARRAAELGYASKDTGLERLVGQLTFGRHVGTLLEQANINFLTGHFILLSFFLMLVGLFSGMLWGSLGSPIPMRGPVLGLIFALILGSLPYLYLLDQKRKRIKKFTEQFPDALEMMGRSLRAGHGFNVSMQMVGQEMPDPVGTVFRWGAEEQNLGLNLNDVMSNMARRLPTLDVEFFASAVAIQRETGGNLAEIMDKLGHVIRERFRILGQIRVFTIQGRMSGFILSLMPIVMALVIYMINPDYILTLFKEKLGWYIVGTAVGLQVVGIIVIRKIVNIKV